MMGTPRFANGVAVMKNTICVWISLAFLPLLGIPGSADAEELWGDDLASRCSCWDRGTLMQWSYGTSFSGGPDREAPLVTDRPDFTEASSTVGRGVVQLEVGYTYVYDNDGTNGVRTHSFPEALARIGVFAEWLELRIAWNYSEETTRTAGAVTGTARGAEDLYLGFKIGLTPQEGLLPEMAIIPQMNVPTGSGGVSDRQVLPGFNWIYGWELNDWLSAAGSTQFNRRVDGTSGDNYTEWAQSWTFGYSLTEKLGGYTEWFALFPTAATTELPQYYFNGGFTYLINNDLQFDIRGGVGLNNAADDYFLGTGFSIRR